MAENRVREMKRNAIRSGIVVLGALAFGYLSLQIGFKPYLDKAQQQLQQSQSQSQSASASASTEEPFSFPERNS
ncbi:hypothetical protein RIF29_40676 [Crotalaria pallida]|uniref:Uncharacterized protein n=1 Tax=Crotalaria pallida TaxID=3830 RepID=A0AAN9E3M0_CROPI